MRRDEGGARLRSRRDVRRPRRGPRAHGRRARARRRAQRGVGGAARGVGGGLSRTPRRSASSTCAASRATGWREALPEFAAGEQVATRDAGKTVMQALKPLHADDGRRRGRPRRVDEDRVRGRRASSRATHAGRNIAFGIREHAMGVDRERDRARAGDAEAVRLDLPRLLRLHAPGRPPLGADGAAGRSGSGRTTRSGSARTARRTSPSSTCMALRAIPNLWFVRPADANETVAAWRIALERDDGPVALALTPPEAAGARPRRRRRPPRARCAARTSLWQRDPAAEPEADRARDRLRGAARARGGARRSTRTSRVVSMPCWELFDEQPDELPRRGAAAGRRRHARLGRGRGHARLGALGRPARRERRRRPLRRLGARRADLRGARHHRRGRRAPRSSASLG